jgi:hypothetical protein
VTIASVGAEFHSTGVPTATLPGTHAANDILLLILQSSNDSVVAAPAGYTQLGPENGIGAGGVAGSTKLSIFWKRDGGAESAPTIPDTGDHTYGVMIAVRGCPTHGDPFHSVGQAWKFAASTAATAKAGSTVVDASLVMSIFGHATDSTGNNISGSAVNASLGSVTTQFDGMTTDGTGGGIAVITGTLNIAGSLSATTLTWANSTVDVSTTLCFIPSDSPVEDLHPAEVQAFIGSPTDLDDTWVKPAGARRVFAQIVDGGGGGSSGNTTTTAAGGGGGGGGGCDEAWYDAGDLAATVTVHAGKGGAANAALNAAGNPGVISEFWKGSAASPLSSTHRIAGTAATAAASADGGNGGCGSGRGLVSPTVNTTRKSIEGLSAANSIAAVGGIGGAGGSGTTSPVGGSPSDWGGGGGESGADTDAPITSANNGWSLRGGGGGGGGRTSQASTSGSGAGGGAAGVGSSPGASGTDSATLGFGGSGGCGGNSIGTVTGGAGGFPGGGGGGGGGAVGGFGGRGGHGVVVVTTVF